MTKPTNCSATTCASRGICNVGSGLPPDDAKKVLDTAKVPYLAQEVLVLDLENAPGALQRVSAHLAEAGINIHYAYGTADLAGRGGALVLRVSDLERAVAILEGGDAGEVPGA